MKTLYMISYDLGFQHAMSGYSAANPHKEWTEQHGAYEIGYSEGYATIEAWREHCTSVG